MEKFSNINELIIALLIWITSNSDYVLPKKEITVETVEQSKLASIACGKECEILAYTPLEPKYLVFLSENLDPQRDVCDRAILMHELIHVLQEEQGAFSSFDERTKKHMREMDALVKHNIFARP